MLGGHLVIKGIKLVKSSGAEEDTILGPFGIRGRDLPNGQSPALVKAGEDWLLMVTINEQQQSPMKNS